MLPLQTLDVGIKLYAMHVIMYLTMYKTSIVWHCFLERFWSWFDSVLYVYMHAYYQHKHLKISTDITMISQLTKIICSRITLFEEIFVDHNMISHATKMRYSCVNS